MHKAGFVTVFHFISFSYMFCLIFASHLGVYVGFKTCRGLGGDCCFPILKILRLLEHFNLLMKKENYFFFQTNSIKFGKGQCKIFILLCLACFDTSQ